MGLTLAPHLRRAGQARADLRPTDGWGRWRNAVIWCGRRQALFSPLRCGRRGKIPLNINRRFMPVRAHIALFLLHYATTSAPTIEQK